MLLLRLIASVARAGNPLLRIPAGRLQLWSLLMLALAHSAFSEEIEAPEARIKSAFLYNFTKLVTR